MTQIARQLVEDVPVGPQDDYERLPDIIRQLYTREQYLWLSDGDKARLIETETEPDW